MSLTVVVHRAHGTSESGITYKTKFLFFVVCLSCVWAVAGLAGWAAVWRWLSSVTPLGYAFESLLINEFSDADGSRPYRIEGSVSFFVDVRSSKEQQPEAKMKKKKNIQEKN